LRQDAKVALFDAIYFLCATASAREVAYQTIIVGELLKHGQADHHQRQGHVHNPENKLTLTMLGAFAEFERAKIIERTSRGRLHRLRMGELRQYRPPHFWIRVLRKTPTSPAALVINEEQRWWSGRSSRCLRVTILDLSRYRAGSKDAGVPTRAGRARWNMDQVKFMLKNETYAGTRHYNRITAAKGAGPEGAKLIKGQVGVPGSPRVDSGQGARHRPA